MEVIYSDVTIKYDEPSNTWKFELRGRQRSTESLAKAKEAIDKPVKEPKNVFQRVKGHRKVYSGCFIPGEITSIADNGWYSDSNYVWFVTSTERSKQSARDIYPDTPENLVLLNQHIELSKQIKVLESQQRSLMEKLKAYEIPQEEDAI